MRKADLPSTLEEFCALPDEAMDVALGAAFIARDVYGGLDVRALVDRLDDLARPLEARGLAGEGPRVQAAALADHVYETLGFRGNEEDYYDPRNSLLSDVLDRRLGIPITLGIVYAELARRVGVRTRGIAFPGHFLVRIEHAPPTEEAALVIDPFFGGRVLGHDAIERLLRRALGPKQALLPEHLAAASPRAILVRVLTNLKAIYLTRGDHARAHLALDRIVSLMPDATGALRERGLLAARLGAVEAARADLARVLELEPNASDAQALSSRLAELSSSRRAPN